jgi:hypothetical protein
LKLLLDENLPHDLRHHLQGHEAITVTYMKWSGTKNGELLRLAASANFDALLTMDNGVSYQQNTATLPIAIIILSTPSNDIDDLLPLLPALRSKLQELAPRKITRIP